MWDLRAKREMIALAYSGGAATAGNAMNIGAMAMGGRRGMSDVCWHPDNVSALGKVLSGSFNKCCRPLNLLPPLKMMFPRLSCTGISGILELLKRLASCFISFQGFLCDVLCFRS